MSRRWRQHETCVGERDSGVGADPTVNDPRVVTVERMPAGIGDRQRSPPSAPDGCLHRREPAVTSTDPVCSHGWKRPNGIPGRRHALDHDEIRVAYEPVLELSTGLLIGTEALLRVDVDGCWVLPPTLIGVAENSGPIVEVGLRVFQLTAQQAAQWHAEHGVWLPVAVNRVGRPA